MDDTDSRFLSSGAAYRVPAAIRSAAKSAARPQWGTPPFGAPLTLNH